MKKTLFVFALVIMLILGGMAAYSRISLHRETISSVHEANPTETNISESSQLSEEPPSGIVSSEETLSADHPDSDKDSGLVIGPAPAAGNDSDAEVFDEIVVEFDEGQGYTIG